MCLIYKICPGSEWDDALRRGSFEGSAVDLADGFIHFSTAAQVAETAHKHFRGQDGLMLVAVDSDRLGPALKWEPSRGGALFPHLYGPLLVAQARFARPLPMRPDGSHDLTGLVTPDGTA